MRKPQSFIGFLSLFAAMIVLFSDSPGLAQSSNLLKKYDGLRGKEREQKLIDGAKKEGKVVIYSFTAVDQLKPLLDEFQKYPFVTEIVGPNFKEFTKLYNEIFGIGK